MAEENKTDTEKKLAEVKNSMQAIAANHDLSKMYNDNAEVGTENLGGKSPLLTLYAAGRSQTRLADGSKPTDGFYVYQPTGEQLEKPTVHILCVSAGFKAKGLKQKDGTVPIVFNQLIGGVITSTPKPLPFVMYLTGKKLQPMWNFGEEAKKFTHAKPFAIPMFALNVELSAFEEPNEYGSSFVPKFTIIKNEDGSPVIPTTVEEFTFYKDMVSQMSELLQNIVKAKAGEEDETLNVANYRAEHETFHDDSEIPLPDEEEKESDDVPF